MKKLLFLVFGLSYSLSFANELIIDDEHYLKEYKRGTKAKFTFKAIKGGLVGAGVLFLVAAYGLSLLP